MNIFKMKKRRVYFRNSGGGGGVWGGGGGGGRGKGLKTGFHFLNQTKSNSLKQDVC